MRSKGLIALRRRIDRGEPDEFVLFPELRAEGLVDYAAHIVPFDPAQAEVLGRGSGRMTRSGPGQGAQRDLLFLRHRPSRKASTMDSSIRSSKRSPFWRSRGEIAPDLRRREHGARDLSRTGTPAAGC